MSYDKSKVAAYTREWERKKREEGLEVRRFVWIRKDVWAAIEVFQDEYRKKFDKRITFKQLINEALFDLILRRKQEELHGVPVKLKDTEFDPEKGTIFKNE